MAGLLAGDAFLFLYLLENAMAATYAGGGAKNQIAAMLDVFVLYSVFSLVGWLLVGLPLALLLPVHFIRRWPWPVVIAVGFLLGPAALFLILLMLARGQLRFPASFTGTGVLFLFSLLVSTVSFGVYAILLRRGARNIDAKGRPC